MAIYEVGPGKTYATITDGLAASGGGAGNEVVVYDNGSPYAEGNLSVTGETLRSAVPGTQIEIDATGYSYALILNAAAIVADFDVSGATLHGVAANGVTSVNNVNSHDNTLRGFSVANGGTWTNIRAINNGSAGFQFTSGSTGTLSVAEVRGNGAGGVFAAGWVVEHISTYDNGGTHECSVGSTGTARNVCAKDGAVYGIYALTYDNCCAHGCGTANFQTSPDAESIEADPLYKDAASGDLSLQAGSPCRGAGSVAASATTDIDGETYLSPPSIGAHEYTADPIMDPLIEIWHYHALDGLAEIQINEGGGAVTLTLDQPYVFADALQYWQDAANAHGSLSATYTFSYDEDAGTVTFAATAAFALTLSHSLYDALGFATETLPSSSSHTSTGTVTAFWAPDALQRDAPYPLEEVDLLEFRLGRADAMVQYHGAAMKVVVLGPTSVVRELLESPLLGGKVRVHETDYRTTEYGVGSTHGYVDGHAIDISDMSLIGDEHQLAEVTILLQVEV